MSQSRVLIVNYPNDYFVSKILNAVVADLTKNNAGTDTSALGHLPDGILVSFGTTTLLTYQVDFGWTLSNYGGIFQSLYLEPILRSFIRATASATVAFASMVST